MHYNCKNNTVTSHLNGQASLTSFNELLKHKNTINYIHAAKESWLVRTKQSVGKFFSRIPQAFKSKPPTPVKPESFIGKELTLSEKHQQLCEHIEKQRNQDLVQFNSWRSEFHEIIKKKPEIQPIDTDSSPATKYESTLDDSFLDIKQLLKEIDKDLQTATRNDDFEAIDSIHLAKLTLSNRLRALQKYVWQHKQYQIELGIIREDTSAAFPIAEDLRIRAEQIKNSFLTGIDEFKQEFDRRSSTAYYKRPSPPADLYDFLCTHISNYQADMCQLNEHAKKHEDSVFSEVKKAKTNGPTEQSASIEQLLKELTLPDDSPYSMEFKIWKEALTDNKLLTFMHKRARQDKLLYTNWLQAVNNLLNKTKFPLIYTRQSHNHGPLFLKELIATGNALQHAHDKHRVIHDSIYYAIGYNQQSNPSTGSTLQDQMDIYSKGFKSEFNSIVLETLTRRLQQQIDTYVEQEALTDLFLASASPETKSTIGNMAILMDRVENGFEKQIHTYTELEERCITDFVKAGDYLQYHTDNIAPLEKDLNQLVKLTDQMIAETKDDPSCRQLFEGATEACQSRQNELTNIKEQINTLIEDQKTPDTDIERQANKFHQWNYLNRIIDENDDISTDTASRNAVTLHNQLTNYLTALSAEEQHLQTMPGYLQLSDHHERLLNISKIKSLFSKQKLNTYDYLVAHHPDTAITTAQAADLPIHAGRSTNDILDAADETILLSMNAVKENHLTEKAINKYTEGICITIEAVKYCIMRNENILRDATDALSKIIPMSPGKDKNETEKRQQEYDQLNLIIKEAPEIITELKEKKTALENTGNSLIKLRIATMDKEFDALAKKIGERTSNPNLNEIKLEDIQQEIKSCNQFLEKLQASKPAQLIVATLCPDHGIIQLQNKIKLQIKNLSELDNKVRLIKNEQIASAVSYDTQSAGIRTQTQASSKDSTATPDKLQAQEDVKLIQLIHRGPRYQEQEPGSKLQQIRRLFIDGFSKNKTPVTSANSAANEASITVQQPVPMLTANHVPARQQQPGNISASNSPAINHKEHLDTAATISDEKMSQLLKDSENKDITAKTTIDIFDTVLLMDPDAGQAVRVLYRMAENRRIVKHLAGHVTLQPNPSRLNKAAYYIRSILAAMGFINLANYGPTKLTEFYETVRRMADSEENKGGIIAEILNNKSTPDSFKRRI